MRRHAFASSMRRHVLAGALALALTPLGCNNRDGYYYITEINGEGDTVLFQFVFTCGRIEIEWNGSFGGPPSHRIDLAVHHDAEGNDCAEDPRDVAFDVGPMKRSFRAEHPAPSPLGLRIPPYEEEQGAICLMNLFQDEPFKGRRCK
jgi:hypothetical protein